VEYSLTKRGWSITGPLMGMYEWAAEHLDEDRVDTSRGMRRLEVVREPLAA
jgi:DNA-binding HxlR family transcriptional regulator